MFKFVAATVVAFCFFSFAQAESTAQSDPYAIFAAHSNVTRYQLDHSPWSEFLRRAVYLTGHSDRVAARRDTGFRNSGTRLTTGSTSRYRYEANRVLFHEFNDDVREYVSIYRRALQDTINRIDYAALSRDEQLAFWLNLHNAVVMDEVARAHPIARPETIRVGENGERLFEAKLVSVHGVALSLNDIRYKIVYRYWRSPDVIYGLWTGEIGGPNIQSTAFTGSSVRRQLQVNAREFVNALRGVDRIRGRLRLSPLYFDAQDYYFSNWPEDVYRHLSQYANGDAADALDLAPESPRPLRFDSSTADLSAGETRSYSGNDNAAIIAAGEDLGGRWANLSSTGLRGGLPGEALKLQRKIDERREDRPAGTVIIIDIYTDEPDEETETLAVEPDQESND